MLVSKTIEVEEDTLRKTAIKSIKTVITNGSGVSTINYPKVVNLTDFEYTTIGGTEILNPGETHIKILLPTDITNNYITYFYVNNKNDTMIVNTEADQYNYTITNAFTRNGTAVFNASFRDINDRVAFQIGSNIINDSDQETYNMSVNTKYYSFIFNESDIPSEIEPESTQNIKNVTINRNYDSVNPLIIEPDEGYDNMDAVAAVVNVPNGTETTNITSNGTYIPTSPNIGFSSVSVNVPQPTLEDLRVVSTAFNTNGEYYINPHTGYDAMEQAKFTVSVPNGTETTNITSNGTYTPTSPNIGFSNVTVSVPSGTKIIFNRFKIFYYTSSSSNSLTNKYVNPSSMASNLYNVNVTSGQSIFYISSVFDNRYQLGFYNNNSTNTVSVGMPTLDTLYSISTGQFIKRISLYNSSTEVLSNALNSINQSGSVPYMLNYEISTDLPSSAYQFNSS